MAESNKTVMVVGLGRFGVSLSLKLAEMKRQVIAVDRNPARVKEVAEEIEICAQINATDEEALVKIGAKEVDVAVVAIGENIEASIMVTTILKGYNIPFLVARAQNPLHARILAKVGADRVIFPEKEMGERVADQLVHPWLNRFSQLPGAESIIGEVEPVPEMTGKTLLEQEFRKTYEVVILMIKKNGKYMIPRPDTIIDREDTLLVAGQKEQIEKIIKMKEKEGKES